MTRDEAISKVQLSSIRGEAQGLVASLENLGLLKLDEPKSVYDRVWDLVGNSKIVQGGHWRSSRGIL